MRHVPQCGPSILNGTSHAKFHWPSGPSAPPETAKLGERGTDKTLPLPCHAPQARMRRIGSAAIPPCLSSNPGIMR